MKVTAILKGMIDANGHQPVQIRISHEGRRTFKPTGIKLAPDLFKDGKVDKKHPKAGEWNKLIETKIIQYQAQALEGFRKKKAKIDFYDYVEQTTKNLSRESGTLRQYGSQVTKLKEFRPSFYLSDVDHKFLDDYKAFLKKEKGNEGNTVWSSFKFLRTFIRKAWKAGMIESYPFDNYEFPPYKDPPKVWLTEEDLKAFDKTVRGKNLSPNLYEAGCWFLIACDTGIRMADIENFDKKKNIVGGRVVFKTEKTGEMVGLPIDNHLKKLFERVHYKKLSMHRNTYNELIKIVAAAAGIDKHISSHTARHTAAMTLANKGVSQEVVAKILGQKDLRSTAVYYKITNQRIDLELKKRRK